MKEGEILLRFIDNQTKAKTQIAKDLGMSRRNLYQIFDSQELEEITKSKFEEYFKKKIFSKEAYEENRKEAIGKIVAEQGKNVSTQYSHADEKIQDLKDQIKELKEDKAFIKKQFEDKLNKIEANLNTALSNQDGMVQMIQECIKLVALNLYDKKDKRLREIVDGIDKIVAGALK